MLLLKAKTRRVILPLLVAAISLRTLIRQIDTTKARKESSNDIEKTTNANEETRTLLTPSLRAFYDDGTKENNAVVNTSSYNASSIPEWFTLLASSRQDTTSTSTGSHGADSFCSFMSANGASSDASTLWSEHLDSIRESLLHSPANNKPFGARSSDLQPLIDGVLNILSPARLRRSLRPVSADWHMPRIRRILNVLLERRRHPESAPPLQVLVFGGSPTVGSNCERNKKYKKNGACAWPGHLQEFTNHLLGFDAIRVINYGMGASSSEVATMILNFRLFPDSMLPDGPDVIINAYSVNDFSYYVGGGPMDGAGRVPRVVQGDNLDGESVFRRMMGECDNDAPALWPRGSTPCHLP